MLRNLVILFAVFAFVLPVFAQDATPEPTPEVPVVTVTPAADLSVFIVGAIAIVVLVVLAVIGREAIVKLAVSAPEWTVDALFDIVDRAMEGGEAIVGKTPAAWDDAALDDLAAELAALRAEIATLRRQVDG